MDAPNPMVTFFKTLDVTPLVRLSRRRGYKFNMLLCWCIGRAFICSLWDGFCSGCRRASMTFESEVYTYETDDLDH